MQLLIYILVYPWLWIISKLPFPLLYALSDFFFLIFYSGFGYRKKVVLENLKLALPDLSEKQRRNIAKKFYHHLCDVIFESIKSISITEDELKKRFKFENLELFESLESKDKSAIVIMGHYGNWEWIFILQRYVNHKGYGVYKQLKNKYFDRLVKRLRARYNTQLITTKTTIKILNDANSQGELTVSGFISDQSPKKDKAFHWNKFMGINVPVYTGAEMLAKKLDHAVVFARIEKPKRGNYVCKFQLITDEPQQIPDYKITDQMLHLLEQQIYEAPEFYLWTHKRWKHRKK